MLNLPKLFCYCMKFSSTLSTRCQSHSIRNLCRNKQFKVCSHSWNHIASLGTPPCWRRNELFNILSVNQNDLLFRHLRGIRTTVHLHDKKKKDDDEHRESEVPPYFPAAIAVTCVCLAVVALFITMNEDQTTTNMSWDEFLQKVLPSGEVKQIYVGWSSSNSVTAVLHNDATIDGKKIHAIKLGMIDSTKLEELLREEERKLNIHPDHYIQIIIVTASGYGPYLVLGGIAAFIVFTMIFLIKHQPLSKNLESSLFTKMFGTDVITKVKTNVKFKDVAGMKEAKQEVVEFVHFLKNPTHYTRLGAKMPRGCLLTGPPGVGKTMLAKAVANEAEVPFIAKAGSDFVELIGGLGARRIRQLFEKARESAPCIVYIDELDALGGSRSKNATMSSSETDQTLNQLLVEMDGMLSKQHQVIVLASTNRQDILDNALLRPGRFDRLVHIDLPNRQERQEILDQHLEKIKLKGNSDEYSSILARETPGMSGADLANICNEAAIYAARLDDVFVEKKHLDYALERVTSGAPKSSTSISPEEREKVAVHESGHALVGWLMEHTDAVSKITIIPRSSGMLGFSRTLPSDRYLYTEEQLFEKMCVRLGGRAAENIIYGNVTQGAKDDLEKVTEMAYAQVKSFGFNPVIGPLSYKQEGELEFRPYSEALATTIDMEVRSMVKKAYDKTEELLEENRPLLERLSSELFSRETLNYDEVELLIGPPPYQKTK